MTFDEVIAEATVQGWYLYNLCSEPLSEGLDGTWRCTLRALSGPPRREISNGKGFDWLEAICNALSNAPELEPEVTISSLKARADTFHIDVRALGLLKPRQPINRRI